MTRRQRRHRSSIQTSKLLKIAKNAHTVRKSQRMRHFKQCRHNCCRMLTLSNTRYFTYLGLCVATAIIFQRSSAIAGVLGVVVAAYVTLSEYYLQGATGELKPIGHSDF